MQLVLNRRIEHSCFRNGDATILHSPNILVARLSFELEYNDSGFER
jgi:hypothetical protein